MEIQTFYICSKCKAKYHTAREAEECEAMHPEPKILSVKYFQRNKVPELLLVESGGEEHVYTLTREGKY